MGMLSNTTDCVRRYVNVHCAIVHLTHLLVLKGILSAELC